MTPKPRLEPTEVTIDGPCLRIRNLCEDPDVLLYFKSDKNATVAGRAIQNYLEIVDVDPTDDGVMHMLQLVLGRPEFGD